MTDQKMPQDAAPEEATATESAEASTPADSRAATKPDKGGTEAAGTATGSGPEEPPFIDDPVSKWWIAIIIAVFALIFAWAIFFGGGGLLSGVFDPEDQTPSPEPTLVASPSPAASEEASTAPVDASIEPSEGPTAEPAAEPTVEPTAQATEEPTAGPTAGPTVEPTAQATEEPTAESTLGPCGSTGSGCQPGARPDTRADAGLLHPRADRGTVRVASGLTMMG